MLVKLICRIEEWRDDLGIGDLAWRSFVPPLNSEQSRGENNGFLLEFGRYESMTRNLELSKLQQKGNNVGSRTTWIPLYYHRKDIRSVSNYIIKITQQPVYISVERRESVDRGTRWNVIYIYNNMLLITLHHISKVNIYTYIYYTLRNRRKIHHHDAILFEDRFIRESTWNGQTEWRKHWAE